MLAAEKCLRDGPAAPRQTDDVPMPVYHSLDDDDDEMVAEEEGGTLSSLCRAPARDHDEEDFYRSLEDQRRPGSSSSSRLPSGVQTIGATQRCIASTVEQLEIGTPPSIAPSSKTLSKKAKLYILFLALVCIVILLHSHFTSAEADVLHEEVKKLRSLNKGLAERAQLVEAEKQDLANLLLNPRAKNRLKNMMSRSRGFDEFIRTFGFQSTPDTTASVRQCLGDALYSLNIASVLDIPCGDGSWQHLVPGIDKVAYVGADINPSALEAAKQRKSNAASPNMEFMLFDAVHFPLRRKFDLIVFRDIVEQQRVQDTLTAIMNFNQSGSVFLAATYWPSSTEEDNAEGYRLEAAGMYMPNLLLNPFNFPAPLFSCDNVDEGSKYRGKSKLGFWRFQSLGVTDAILREVRHHAGRLRDESRQKQEKQKQEQQDISLDELIRFFGGALNPPRRSQPLGQPSKQAANPGTQQQAAQTAAAAPFDGLLNDWLERPGAVRREPHPLTGTARSPDFVTHFFGIPMHDTQDGTR